MKGADALAERDVFLEDDAVEGLLSIKVELERRCGLSVGKGPIVVVVLGEDVSGLETAAAGGAFYLGAASQIYSEDAVKRPPELGEPE